MNKLVSTRLNSEFLFEIPIGETWDREVIALEALFTVSAFYPPGQSAKSIHALKKKVLKVFIITQPIFMLFIEQSIDLWYI